MILTIAFWALLFTYMVLFFFARGTKNKDVEALKAFIAALTLLDLGVMSFRLTDGSIIFIIICVLLFVGFIIIGLHLERYDELLKKEEAEAEKRGALIANQVVQSAPPQLPYSGPDRFCIECGEKLPVVGDRCSNPKCKALIPSTGDTHRL